MVVASNIVRIYDLLSVEFFQKKIVYNLMEVPWYESRMSWFMLPFVLDVFKRLAYAITVDNAT